MGIKTYLLLFSISSGICSCIKDDPEAKKFVPYSGPTLQVKNIEVFMTDSAHPKILLNAPLQVEYENGNRYFPKGVKIEFYEANHEKSSILTSKKGRYNKQTGIYTVTQDVVIQNLLEKKKLNTEELHWDPITKDIYTDKFVRIETPEEVLTGQGLKSKEDFNNYKILKPTGIFSLDQP
ncbi:MAG TPA: LPS export ABC transporter periplasmic protein LptC [Cytophagaceae bacterium]|jgi:LPS export ABC transporter protein LptC